MAEKGGKNFSSDKGKTASKLVASKEGLILSTFVPLRLFLNSEIFGTKSTNAVGEIKVATLHFFAGSDLGFLKWFLFLLL